MTDGNIPAINRSPNQAIADLLYFVEVRTKRARSPVVDNVSSVAGKVARAASGPNALKEGVGVAGDSERSRGTPGREARRPALIDVKGATRHT